MKSFKFSTSHRLRGGQITFKFGRTRRFYRVTFWVRIGRVWRRTVKRRNLSLIRFQGRLRRFKFGSGRVLVLLRRRWKKIKALGSRRSRLRRRINRRRRRQRRRQRQRRRRYRRRGRRRRRRRKRLLRRCGLRLRVRGKVYPMIRRGKYYKAFTGKKPMKLRYSSSTSLSQLLIFTVLKVNNRL